MPFIFCLFIGDPHSALISMKQRIISIVLNIVYLVVLPRFQPNIVLDQISAYYGQHFESQLKKNVT